MCYERRVIIGLTLGWLLVYLLGNNLLAVTDPVESNYAETAKEMMLSGDFFSPRIYGNYWYDKPIMFYLELIASFKLFGITDFAARFPTAVMSWCGIMLTYWAGKRLYDQQVGLYAGVLAMMSLEYWYLGHAIITDMTLFVTVSLTLLGFYIGYTEQKPQWYYVAFVAAAVAVLTKGPIGLCLPGLIIMLFLIWQRDFKALFNRHIGGGFVLFFAVTSLWYVPMYFQHGRDFIDTFLGVHNVARATVSEHPRDDVWYYYTLVFLAGFFPWSFMIVPTKIKQWFKQRPCLPKMPRERFLLLWAVTVFVIFQSFATKYVSYTFPYMIPVALLMVPWFQQHKKMFMRTAGAIALVYISLLFFVAAPMMRVHSTSDIAARIRAEFTEDTKLYCFESDEPASLAYYTGVFPQRLISKEKFSSIKSGTELWDVKSVMPLVVYEDIEKDSPILVVTKKGRAESLQKAIPVQWQFVGEYGKYQVYYRPATE